MKGFGIGTRGSLKFWDQDALRDGTRWMLHYNVSETGEGVSNGIEWNGWENAVSRQNRVKRLWDEQWKFKGVLGKRAKMMEQKKTKKDFSVVSFCVYIEHRQAVRNQQESQGTLDRL